MNKVLLFFSLMFVLAAQADVLGEYSFEGALGDKRVRSRLFVVSSLPTIQARRLTANSSTVVVAVCLWLAASATLSRGGSSPSSRCISATSGKFISQQRWATAHLLETLKVLCKQSDQGRAPSTYRGTRIVYSYDDGFHDDFNVSEELNIEYYD